MTKPKDLGELIDQQCAARPAFDVLTFVDIGPDGAFLEEKRSFAALRRNGARLAVWLQDSGVERGGRFAIMMNNHPEFVEAMIAAALLGAIFVPIDPRAVGDKLLYMINFVESTVVIAGGYTLPAIAEIARGLTATKQILVVGSADDVPAMQGMRISRFDRDLPASGDRLVRAPHEADAPMFMMFTSGTTGNPKAVVRTHASYMAGINVYKALGVEAGDTLYTGLPLSHVNAQSTLAASLSMGIPAVFSRKFTKSRLWDICKTYGCTVFNLLGGMIPEVYSIPEKAEDASNPVRLILAAGMPAALWPQYRRRFGVEITELYGSTEGGGVLINRMGEGPAGSMGRPPAGMLAVILDEAGQPCAPHQPGELCFRSQAGVPTAVLYYRNEAASQKKVHGGWFRSGDIAHMDEDGWVYFHHREGGGVRRNGDFVNTGMVETVLAKSSFVEDVFVYGVQAPTSIAGEKALVAAVVLRAGADAADVARWCADKLQKNEIPEIWQVLTVIPKTISEKPIERECIALLGGKPDNSSG